MRAVDQHSKQPTEAEKPKPPTEEELKKASNVMEIFGLTETAALVALRRNKFVLDETVTKLATEEQFLASVLEEASKVMTVRTSNQHIPARPTRREVEY